MLVNCSWTCGPPPSIFDKTTVTPLEKNNWFSLCQLLWLQTDSCFVVGAFIHLLFLVLRYCLTWSYIGCVYTVSFCKFICASVLSWLVDTIFLKLSTMSGSYTFSPPLLQQSLNLVEKGLMKTCHVGTACSKVFHSLDIVQLWVSVIILKAYFSVCLLELSSKGISW